MNREEGGALVRKAWVQWAERQPQPIIKPSWLVEWAELSEFDKEADRCIFDMLWAAFQQEQTKQVDIDEFLANPDVREALLNPSRQKLTPISTGELAELIRAAQKALEHEQQRIETLILGIIAFGTLKSGYVATWHIAHSLNKLGYDVVSFGSSIPGTKYDDALESLVKQGLVEELPDLPFRYRLVKRG